MITDADLQKASVTAADLIRACDLILKSIRGDSYDSEITRARIAGISDGIRLLRDEMSKDLSEELIF